MLLWVVYVAIYHAVLPMPTVPGRRYRHESNRRVSGSNIEVAPQFQTQILIRDLDVPLIWSSGDFEYSMKKEGEQLNCVEYQFNPLENFPIISNSEKFDIIENNGVLTGILPKRHSSSLYVIVMAKIKQK